MSKIQIGASIANIVAMIWLVSQRGWYFTIPVGLAVLALVYYREIRAVFARINPKLPVAVMLLIVMFVIVAVVVEFAEVWQDGDDEDDDPAVALLRLESRGLYLVYDEQPVANPHCQLGQCASMFVVEFTLHPASHLLRVLPHGSRVVLTDLEIVVFRRMEEEVSAPGTRCASLKIPEFQDLDSESMRTVNPSTLEVYNGDYQIEVALPMRFWEECDEDALIMRLRQLLKMTFAYRIAVHYEVWTSEGKLGDGLATMETSEPLNFILEAR